MASTVETTPDVSLKDSDSGEDEMYDIMFSKRGCCHWIPIFSCGKGNAQESSSIWWERIGNSSPGKEEERGWWSKGLNAFKKLREWSELVAGPRWKTFIRRFNKNTRGCCGIKNGKFHYDPLSYALNFDDGQGSLGVDYVFRDFSSRYAAIPVMAKSSMDLGRDTTFFT